MDRIVDLWNSSGSSWAIAVALLFTHTVALLSAFHSLQHVRTSQAAVAWVVGLVTLPYLTIPLYWIFARHRFEGYREAVREVGEAHERAVEAVRQELMTDQNARSTSLESALEQVADVLDTPISIGNQFELLIDGEAFMNAVVNQIRSAQKYVYAEFYIIRDDETGRRFADALIERAESGVTVRLLYDEVGCLRLSNRYLQRLSAAGVDVRAFNTRQGWVNRLQINFRNHRKLLVVDGLHAIVGGLNIGDEYLGKAQWAGHWRDTSVRISGGLARKIQAVFACDYYWAARTGLPEADWMASESHVRQGHAVVCSTGPADVRPRAAMMFSAAIQSASQRLWISTPYLIPDESLMVGLAMAKSRGVDVKILIPSVVDDWPVYLAGFHYERELAELDIPVYRYQDGMLHQKCVLVDESLVLIGSTNLDNRSLALNFELMIATDERGLIDEVAQMLSHDFGQSRQSNADEKPDRPWFARAGTAVARLLSPVL